jgi:hypothetical protein
MSDESTPNREQLEADANLLRERIAQNLESLDQRRHEAFNVKAQVARHPLPVALLGAGAVLAIAGGSGLLAYRAHQRKQHRFGDTIAALSHAWHHPDELIKQRETPMRDEIVRGVVVSVVSFVGAQLAKHALQKFMPELFEESPDVATR